MDRDWRINRRTRYLQAAFRGSHCPVTVGHPKSLPSPYLLQSCSYICSSRFRREIKLVPRLLDSAIQNLSPLIDNKEADAVARS